MNMIGDKFRVVEKGAGEMALQVRDLVPSMVTGVQFPGNHKMAERRPLQ